MEQLLNDACISKVKQITQEPECLQLRVAVVAAVKAASDPLRVLQQLSEILQTAPGCRQAKLMTLAREILSETVVDELMHATLVMAATQLEKSLEEPNATIADQMLASAITSCAGFYIQEHGLAGYLDQCQAVADAKGVRNLRVYRTETVVCCREATQASCARSDGCCGAWAGGAGSNDCSICPGTHSGAHSRSILTFSHRQSLRRWWKC